MAVFGLETPSSALDESLTFARIWTWPGFIRSDQQYFPQVAGGNSSNAPTFFQRHVCVLCVRVILWCDMCVSDWHDGVLLITRRGGTKALVFTSDIFHPISPWTRPDISATLTATKSNSSRSPGVAVTSFVSVLFHVILHNVSPVFAEDESQTRDLILYTWSTTAVTLKKKDVV